LGCHTVPIARVDRKNLAQQDTLKEASWVVEGNLGREMTGGGIVGPRDGDGES